MKEKAFPRPRSEKDYQNGAVETYDAQDGMDLRDWFAGLALQGMLSNPSEIEVKVMSQEGKKNRETTTEQTYSRVAYQYADAMMKAREKEKSE